MPDLPSHASRLAEGDDEGLDVPVNDPDPEAAAKADEDEDGGRSRLAEDDPNRSW